MITTTANVIEQAMGYQDIADVCAKILNRVALEHLVEVMKCPAIGMLTQMSDFFEKMTQEKILQLIKAVSRSAQSETDFNQYMIPILEWLNMRMGTDDSQQSENLSNTVITIVFSIYNFVGGSDFTGHKRLITAI